MKAIYQPKYDKTKFQIEPAKKYPKVITIWASGSCNFKCSYCIHSADKKVLKSQGFDTELMSWETYALIMDQLTMFPKKPESIVFCGVGEPLLNTSLPDMIYDIRKYNKADYVEVTTNASLLTYDLSLSLLDSGLNSLTVSIQGVSSESYKEVCGCSCDVEELVKQLEYFYRHKRQCKIHIKTVDIALKKEWERKLFIDMFSPVCDTIHIDCAFPLFPDLDYSFLLDGAKNQYTAAPIHEISNTPCNLPKYGMFIQPKGFVVPCCVTPNPVVYGSIYNSTLKDMWNSSKRQTFLELQEGGNRYENHVCSRCYQPSIL